MTYRPMTQTDRRVAVICSQDGIIVADQMQHEEHHRYTVQRGESTAEVDRLKQELQRADEAAQGHAERCAAAVRLAEAARGLHGQGRVTVGGQPVYNGPTYTQQSEEFTTALELWEQLRES